MIGLYLVAGMKGSGKTSLIHKLLSEKAFSTPVLWIQNDFGMQEPDLELLGDTSFLMPLSTGCICCAMPADFPLRLRNRVERLRPKTILLEASTDAKISDSKKLLEQIGAKLHGTFKGSITLLEVESYEAYADMGGSLFQEMIQESDFMLLSTDGEAEEEERLACIQALQEENPNMTLFTQTWDTLSGEQLRERMESCHETSKGNSKKMRYGKQRR